MNSIPFRISFRLFAAIALPLIAFLTACGGSSESDGKTILLYDTGIEPVNQNMWHAAIKTFEAAHPGHKVDFKAIKDDDYSQGGKLIAALRSKNPPDVYFEWTWSAVERDAQNGNALDLSPYVTPEFKASLDPHAWAGTDFNGKPYMVPFGYEVANLLFYRKKTLSDNGIEVPKTWEEFVAACAKLKAAGVTPIMQGNQAAWPAGNWASELVAVYLGPERYKQAGATPPQVKLTDPAFVEAVTRLKELRDAGAFSPSINTMNDNEGIAHFVSGEGAFIFAGSWTIEQLTEAGGEANFGVMRRPSLPNQPANSDYVLANSTGYMINAKTPDPELAFDLLRHLLQPGPQRIRIESGVNSTNAEVQKEIKSPLQIQVHEILAASGEWIAAPDISWNRFTAERFYEAVKEIVGGTAEPLPALEAAANDVAARQ